MEIAIYARVSTEKQEQQQTIRSQIQELDRYASTNGHTIKLRYVDDGWSGSVLARPALDKLRDDAAKRQFDAVLIHSPDRLARNYVQQELLIEELKKRGAHIIFLNRPLADTPEDKMLQGMQGLFAEYEKTKIVERFRRGKLHKARSGRIVGHMAPFGYSYVKRDDKKEGYYVTDEREAAIVRFIFTCFVERQMTLGGLVKLLHQEGMRPRKRDERWQRSSLSRILRNETYTGTTYYNKGYSVEPARQLNPEKYKRVPRSSRRYRPREEWIPIVVPTIISKLTFESAQEQLKRNLQFSARRTKRQYLLKGMTRCGLCSALYAGIPCHGTRHYRCTNKERRFPLPKNCNARMISAEIIEPLVWSSVCDSLNNPKTILEQFERLRERVQQQAESRDGAEDKRKAALAGLAEEEARLVLAYRETVITLDQLREALRQVEAERARVGDEAARSLHVTDLSNAKAWLRRYRTFVRERTKKLTFDERQQFLRSFLREILVFDGEIQIKGSIPQYQPQDEGDVSLRPNGMYSVDANEHLEFVITKELKHGKARPKRLAAVQLAQ